jgi:hypothetical protein
LYVVWGIALVMLATVGWAIVRSKAKAPAVK